MLRAMIVIGGSYKFIKSGQILKTYLKQELHMVAVCSIATAYANPGALARRLKIEFDKLLPGDVMLFSYFGHGLRDVWDINEDFRFSYTMIANLLNGTLGRVLFINDCCYSGSIVRIFEELKVPKNRIGLIASCKDGQLSLASELDSNRHRLAVDVVENWRQATTSICGHVRHPLNINQWFIQPVIRWGAEDPSFRNELGHSY